jgi:hypothetical protein
MAHMMDSTHGYAYEVVAGKVYPPFAEESVIMEMRQDFKLRDTDIVIATYPKCGTTWMQQIVLTLLFKGDKSKVIEPMLQAPWLEWMTCFHRKGGGPDVNGESRSVQQLLDWDGSTARGPGPGRRVFKTHAPVDVVPWSGGPDGLGKAKTIVVVRNPKDACVSMFHHSKDGAVFKYSGDFQHFASSLFLKGKVEHDCFWRWHAGWWKAAQSNPAILWVSFEELKQDPVSMVRKIAAFLDVPASDDIVKQVVGASAFEAMQASFKDINKERQSQGKAAKNNHIRRGAVGAWREYLHGDLLSEFDEAHASKCKELELSFPFDFGEDDAENIEPVTKKPKPM